MSLNYPPNKEKQLALKGNKKDAFSLVKTKSKSKLSADNTSPTGTEGSMPSQKRNAETAELSGDAQSNVKNQQRHR